MIPALDQMCRVGHSISDKATSSIIHIIFHVSHKALFYSHNKPLNPCLFFKNLLNLNTTSSTPDPSFILQKLFYKSSQSKPPPHTQPTSNLVKPFFYTTKKSFHLFSETTPKSSSVCEAMKSCALLMSRYEAQHIPSDLAKAEERDKSNGKSNEGLFAETFVTLAEMIFLACG